MSATIMETQLLRLLTSDPELMKRRCIAERLAGEGVRVSSLAGSLGLWTWTGALFEFTPEGADAPAVALQTSAQALIYTRGLFARK